ncbi:hypothetical protein Ocin01_09975 [Orchesella cincta]|uniref:XK-related protein n=1 Tax=Orchesella cincta TaxID=48709 RepID=A0A1D2MUV5_ORCCI|nr:hypothetical protein Ocin01_09975 [Orchesella cincta]
MICPGWKRTNMRLRCTLAGTFAFIILVELGSGLVATVWTAFFYEKNFYHVRNKWWGYSILGIHLAFLSSLFYYVRREACYPRPVENLSQNKSVTMSWLCGMCTAETMAVFGSLYFYDTVALRQRTFNPVVGGAFLVYLLACGLLTAICCNSLWDLICPNREDDDDVMEVEKLSQSDTKGDLKTDGNA